MGASWAVGSAALLGLSAAALLVDAPAPEGPAAVLLVLLAALAFAAWAHGLAQAAHGSRGALAGLAVLALLWGVGRGAAQAWTCRDCLSATAAGPLVLGVVLVLLGAGAARALVAEARRRRGPVQWGLAVGLALPTLLLALYVLLLP